MQPGQSPFELHLNTLKVHSSNLEIELVNTKKLVKFKFELFALADGTFRMKINELAPLKPRYEVQYVLVGEPVLEKYVY